MSKWLLKSFKPLLRPTWNSSEKPWEIWTCLRLQAHILKEQLDFNHLKCWSLHQKNTHISIKFNPQASSKMFENSSFDHQTSEKTPVYISTVQFRETTGPPPWVRSRRHRVDVGPADLGNFGVAVLPAWRCRIPEIVRYRRRGISLMKFCWVSPTEILKDHQQKEHIFHLFWWINPHHGE